MKSMLAEIAHDATGSSNRIARAVLLEVAPSLDVGEITDKGSLNSGAILANRVARVEELFKSNPSSRVIIVNENL